MRGLEGVRVVVTRGSHQAEELASPLRQLGAEVIVLPVIGIVPPADLEPLRKAALSCDKYDWIIFTSANAVLAFSAELPHPAENCRARVATVGAATCEAARQFGFGVSLIPKKYVAESLVEAFRDEDLKGRRILIPSAAVTREVVPTELRKRGAIVHAVEAYRNVIPAEAIERAPMVFREPYPDWVTFASPSAVENLVHLVGIEPLRHVNIATIGPVTSAALLKYGLTVAAEASVSTITGLIDAICGERANSPFV